jgi:hypothetical protein
MLAGVERTVQSFEEFVNESCVTFMRVATDSNRREFARYSSCDGLDGLEIMSALWLEHSFAPHMHDFYAISLNHPGLGVRLPS